MNGGSMRQVVIGAGEVGTALADVIGDAELVDVDGHRGVADVVHIAFPWSDRFTSAVRGYERIYDADLIVVHSTVPVGTCDPHGWVHSPVRGRHPRLAEGIRTFTKHVGGAQAREAADVMSDYGITTAVTPLAATTEAGKIWELVNFGVQVALERAVWDFCEEHHVDYEVAYRDMGNTYNDGYAKLGEDRFVKPVLDHVPGPIGGHCVVQNSHLVRHPLAELVRQVR